MLIHFEQDYDTYFEGAENKALLIKKAYFENLLPQIKDDVPFNLELNDNRYDLYVTDGAYKGACYLGYLNEKNGVFESIDIEIKSKEGALYFYDIFKNSSIDLNYCNNILNDYRFLYYFIYGKTYNHKDILTISDIFSYFRYDGDNYHFKIQNYTGLGLKKENITFTYSKSGYIDILQNKFVNIDTFILDVEEDLINKINYLTFDSLEKLKDAAINYHICNKLNIDKKDIRIDTHKILHMLNY